VITSEFADDPLPIYDDPFLTVGNCLLAALAAGLGGVLAPFVARRTNERTVYVGSLKKSNVDSSTVAMNALNRLAERTHARIK
jgi:hypothetical protein